MYSSFYQIVIIQINENSYYSGIMYSFIQFSYFSYKISGDSINPQRCHLFLRAGPHKRPSQAWVSSNLVFLKRSGCLVSIGSNLAWFGAIVVEILRLEGRWCSVENLIALFLKNSFLPIHGRYRQAFLLKVDDTS